MSRILAVVLLAFSLNAVAADGDVKPRSEAKVQKKKKKVKVKRHHHKDEKASAGGTAAPGSAPAPVAGTDLGLQAEREEARIRRKLNSGDVDSPGE